MINLLPPKEKKALSERRSRRLLNLLGILLSLFFITLSLGLLSTKFYLSGQRVFEATLYEESKKLIENPANQALKEEIRDLNKKVQLISSFYQNRVRVSEVLTALTKTLPPGISLTSLAYQADNSSLNLVGHAAMREDLLSFKDNLETAAHFDEILFPSSSWVKAREINFFLTLKYVSEK